jgi:hypothetical protein
MRATDYHAAEGDLLLAMEPFQLEAVRSFHAEPGVQGTLLGVWCSRPLPYLPDPCGLNEECFEQTFTYIDEATKEVLWQLRHHIPA